MALIFSFGLIVRGETVTNIFGFTGHETFPVDDGIGLLHAADLDGDGLNDLIVVNNLRAKINLLYNLTGRTNQAAAATPPRKLEINELPPDSRFRIDSIPADERIAAMAVTDLNGDGPSRHRLFRRQQRFGSDLQRGHERLERSETLAH